MFDTTSSRTASSSALPTQTPLPVTHARPADTGMCVDSEALLQGQKSVAIMHNGAVYRLQATKLGKLILTK